MTLTVLSTQRFKARQLTFLKGTGAKNTETPHRPHLLKWEQVRKTTGIKSHPEGWRVLTTLELQTQYHLFWLYPLHIIQLSR